MSTTRRRASPGGGTSRGRPGCRSSGANSSSFRSRDPSPGWWSSEAGSLRAFPSSSGSAPSPARRSVWVSCCEFAASSSGRSSRRTPPGGHFQLSDMVASRLRRATSFLSELLRPARSTADTSAKSRCAPWRPLLCRSGPLLDDGGQHSSSERPTFAHWRDARPLHSCRPRHDRIPTLSKPRAALQRLLPVPP